MSVKKNVCLSTLVALVSSIGSAQIALSTDINIAVGEIQTQMMSTKLKASTCATSLKKISDTLFNLPFDYFTNDTTVIEGKNSDDAINKLFQTRIKLNDVYRQMIIKNQFKDRIQLDECGTQIRMTLRSLRELEDLLGLNSLYKQNKLIATAQYKDDKIIVPLSNNTWPHILVDQTTIKSKTFNKNFLKTGDILLSRGTFFAGSPISRIGTIDTQFTHLSIVYIDDGSLFGPQNKGHVYVVESEPDFGLQIVDFERYIRDEKARISLYRYKETNGDLKKSEMIATTAAKFIAKKAYPRVDHILANDTTLRDRSYASPGRLPEKIKYNYTMDLRIEESLFCSQVISYAFNKVCSENNLGCETFSKYENTGRIGIPLNISKIDIKNNSLTEILELKNPQVFSPADIETEPRLQLMAEFRDYNLISESRIFDMVLTKINQYMEQYRYSFIKNETLDTLSKVGNIAVKKSGRLPDYSPDGYARGIMMMAFLMVYTGPGQMIADQVDLLSPEMIKALLISQGVSEKDAQQVSSSSKTLLKRVLNHVSLITRLNFLTEANLKTKGRFLTAKQMDLAMDLIRTEDCKRYISGSGPVMYHDFFRRNDSLSTDKKMQCDQVITPINTEIFWQRTKYETQPH